MDTQILADPVLNLDLQVDAFEEARRVNPRVNLANFLPPRSHPRYLAVLAELVRVEMDQDWDSGHGKPLSDYLGRFPELAADGRLMQEVAFEEFRLRRQAGDPAAPEEYRDRYGVSTEAWPPIPTQQPKPKSAPEIDAAAPLIDAAAPLTAVSDQLSLFSNNPDPVPLPGFRVPPSSQEAGSWLESVTADPEKRPDLLELERDQPETAKRWAEAMEALPEAGSKFLGFRLIEELGRGAFGRVFLAQQADLANRLVAVKVGTAIFEESQTLAQLQHTNVVPIYSFHQIGKLQAVCMPYCGSTTLASVLSHIQSLAGLPSSGRELFSTLNGRRLVTCETGHSSRPASEAGSASPVEETAQPPAADEHDSSETWKLLDGMSFTEAVMWLAARTVDGLVHAHERGVLHRDLKPANVLLADDGTPMLLDFNLAGSELRCSPAGARVGGTLPYMAPEHLAAFRGGKSPPDARSDLYSVGVIMFNLLTGRQPFPSYKGKLADVVKHMRDDRLQPPPLLRPWNPSVSPALEAIVRRCLEPDPADRYQHARELSEDLQRQMRHLPLKHTPEPSSRERFAKWRRRHPRLTSIGSIATISVGVMLGVATLTLAGREQLRLLHAESQYSAHRAELRTIQALLDQRSQPVPRLDEGLLRCANELARYGLSADGPSDGWQNAPDVSYLADADRQRLKEDVGELYFLMAKAAALKAERAAAEGRGAQLASAERWNELAGANAGDRLPRALLEQKVGLARLKGDRGAEKALRERLKTTEPATPRDHYLMGHWLVTEGRYRDALPHLWRATQDDPESFSAWFVRGNAHTGLGQTELAAACYSSCVALRKDFAPAWFNRGLTNAELHFYPEALADFNRAVELDPNLHQAYVERAMVRQALGKWDESVADLTAATEHPSFPTRVWFLRSHARTHLGLWFGAALDRARGLGERPADEISWVSRAEQQPDPAAALADVNEALKLNPGSMFGLQLKAHLLAERLDRPDEALQVLNLAVEQNPDHVPTLAGRGVVLARMGRRAEALKDAEAALQRDSKGVNLYQCANIYALTSTQDPLDRIKAYQLLAAALRSGFGADVIDDDSDMDAVRELPEFRQLIAAAKQLGGAR